jgi:hypothetical protein
VALATFGVTAEIVRADFVPHLSAFSATTAPSSSAVARAINHGAARLAGLLDDRQVDTSAITDSSSAAYFYCQRYIELWVAVHLLRVMTGTNPETVQAWQTELDAMEKAIDTQGVGALGPGASQSGTSEALGPTDWISEGGITTADTSEWSGVDPVLRRDDQL